MNNQQRSITEGEIEALLRHDCPHPSPSLRHRVAQKTWQKEQESMSLFTTLRQWFTPLWRPALALMIGLGLSFVTVSRTARANFNALAREVGAVMFHETTKYPMANNDVEPIIKTPTVVKVSELAAHLPFSVTLPTAVPKGYQLKPYANIYPAEAQSSDEQWHVQIEWQKRQETKETLSLQTISLTIFSPPSSGVIVAPGSITEVMVNGKPTALIAGGWDAGTRTWNTTITSRQFMWTTDQIQYSLMFGGDISLDEATAMAATIR